MIQKLNAQGRLEAKTEDSMFEKVCVKSRRETDTFEFDGRCRCGYRGIIYYLVHLIHHYYKHPNVLHAFQGSFDFSIQNEAFITDFFLKMHL